MRQAVAVEQLVQLVQRRPGLDGDQAARHVQRADAGHPVQVHEQAVGHGHAGERVPRPDRLDPQALSDSGADVLGQLGGAAGMGLSHRVGQLGARPVGPARVARHERTIDSCPWTPTRGVPGSPSQRPSRRRVSASPCCSRTCRRSRTGTTSTTGSSRPCCSALRCWPGCGTVAGRAGRRAPGQRAGPARRLVTIGARAVADHRESPRTCPSSSSASRSTASPSARWMPRRTCRRSPCSIRYGRSILTSFHAAWSAGGIVGALYDLRHGGARPAADRACCSSRPR